MQGGSAIESPVRGRGEMGCGDEIARSGVDVLGDGRTSCAVQQFPFPLCQILDALGILEVGRYI